MYRCLLISSLLLGCLSLSADAATSLSSSRHTYEKAVADIERKAKASLAAMGGVYLKDLDGAMRMYQKQGDLDALLAIQKEKARYQKEQQVPKNAGTASPVARMQSAYWTKAQKTETRKREKTKALTRRYVILLQGLMRSLTKQGKIEDAMEVKKECARCEAALTGTPKPPSPSMPSGTTVTWVKCSFCSGTDKRLGGQCEDCLGSGKCDKCQGSGRRKASLAGGKFRCISCKGTGKCRACKGAGGQEVTCSACSGKGKKAIVRQAAPTSPTSSTHATTTTEDVRPAVTPKTREEATKAREEFQEQIAEYLGEIAVLRKQLNRAEVMSVDIPTAMAAPATYQGKLLSCNVSILRSHAKGLHVRGKASGSFVLLKPDSLATGSKAMAVHRRVGQKQATVTYGITTTGDLVLMAIVPAS